MTRQRQEAGRTGEQAAAQCLARAGYVILARNYRCPFGEIDLVALDRRTVAFVEVKARRNVEVVSPLESVTRRQRRRIARAAAHYLSRHRLLDRLVRFDIVGVWLDGDAPRCELVRGAFESDEWW
ncbi:MAG TPA: YraN family protein [Candidatus Dormibacteraeota bacterium]|nr:YraN family protein [Candidatus Dormibacteraeota bacterium]